jgi:hypothetical protein
MELTIIDPKQFGIEENQALDMTSGLTTILTEREPLRDAFLDIINLEPNEETVKLFRELRLKIRDNRTKGIEPYRKSKGEVFLRAKQFIDATCNNESEQNERMEAQLLEKEKHFENLEKERLATLKAERWIKLQPFTEVEPFGLDLMDETTFDNLLNGAKISHEQKVAEAKRIEEERIEKERKEKLYFDRLREVEKFSDYSANIVDINMAEFGIMSDEEYSEILNKLSAAKLKREKEIEAQRIENERLKKEAEDKDKKLKERNDKLSPYISLIRDYNKVLSMTDAEFENELKVLNKAAIEEANFKYEQEQKAEKERKDIQAEKDRQAKIEADKLAEEERQRKEAEKLAKAPIKKQLATWIESFTYGLAPVKNETSKEIEAKFNSFKDWAKKQVEAL